MSPDDLAAPPALDGLDAWTGTGDRRALWRGRRALMESRRERSTPDGVRPGANRLWFERSIRVAGRVARWTGLEARGRRNALAVRREHLVLHVTGLPDALDGFRLLQISDPHFDALEGTAEAVLAAVRDLEVDLCAFTGDYRAACSGPFFGRDAVLEPMLALTESVRSRHGFFAVLGNHDTHEMVDPFEAIGIRVLANESVRIAHGRARLGLTGLDDVHRYFTGDALVALEEGGGGEPGTFPVALVHSPELAGEAARAGYGLYLCGHTHGGQFCPPGSRPILCPLSRNRHLARGLWREGDMFGYTSRGAGISALPLRFNSAPEVTVVELRAGPPASGARRKSANPHRAPGAVTAPAGRDRPRGARRSRSD